MKKALALVLALVLALSLGVSAFALTLVPVKEASSSKAKLIDVSKYVLDTDVDYEDVYLADPEGGTYYVQLDGTGGKEYKNVEVSGTGIVSAKLVKYDTSKYTGFSNNWHVEYNGNALGTDITGDARYAKAVATVNAKASLQTVFVEYRWYNTNTKQEVLVVDQTGKPELTDFKWFYEREGSSTKGNLAESVKAFIAYANQTYGQAADHYDNWTIIEVYTYDADSQEYNVALAEALNNEFKTRSFEAACDQNIYMIEVTVEPNYTAAYKEGSVKVTADEWDGHSVDSRGRKEYDKVSGTIDIISDVAIFEYEELLWAGKNDKVLFVANETGYSDYLTTLAGYSKANVAYNEQTLRYDEATVISTTGFRGLRENGYGIKVDSEGILVTIPEIVSGQKGVNFAAYEVKAINAKGKEAAKGEAVKVEFGFYGNQTIASDFTVEADLKMDAYELREMFGKKVEEEDIITYYILENGKVAGQFTYDYAKDDIDEEIVIEIKRAAGSTLGQYEIVLEVPTAPAGEENPNTGAESVIGVVAAMAVVSLAAAAAVSLKK